MGVATMSDSRAHHSTAIVIGEDVAQYLRHGVPLAGRKARQEALSHLACRVFQPRRRSAQLFELRERGVEVSFIEYLHAGDHFAVDGHQGDAPPLGDKALVRGSMSGPSENRAEVVQPMRHLGVDVEVLAEVPSGTDVFETFTGRKRCPAAVVETHRIRCYRCDFPPIVRNENTRDYRPGARMSGRFAGEVSGVEFGEGCVEVVKVEHDVPHDPLVGVDLDDVEGIVLNRLGRHGPTRELGRGRDVHRGLPGRPPSSSRSRHRRSPACLSILASRPCKTPAFTTRRRSSTETFSAVI